MREGVIIDHCFLTAVSVSALVAGLVAVVVVLLLQFLVVQDLRFDAARVWVVLLLFSRTRNLFITSLAMLPH